MEAAAVPAMPSYPSPPIPILILAGGQASPEFAAAAGLTGSSPNRALALIGDEPMVQWVIRACRNAELGPVILVAPPGFPSMPGVDRFVAVDEGLERNISLGIAQGAPLNAEQVLLVTADIPFVKPESLRDWVRQGQESGADCCYAALRRVDCDRQFPGMKRTYVRVDGEEMTGGNVVLQRVATYERQAAVLRQAYARRKDPLYLAQLIGLANVARLLTGRLKLAHIEAAASRAMQVRCRLLVSPHADLGADIDRPEDLPLARELARSYTSSQATMMK